MSQSSSLLLLFQLCRHCNGTLTNTHLLLEKWGTVTTLDHQTQKPLELTCRRNSEESGETAYKPLGCCKQSSMRKSEVQMSSMSNNMGAVKTLFTRFLSDGNRLNWKPDRRPSTLHSGNNFSIFCSCLVDSINNLSEGVTAAHYSSWCTGVAGQISGKNWEQKAELKGLKTFRFSQNEAQVKLAKELVVAKQTRTHLLKIWALVSGPH